MTIIVDCSPFTFQREMSNPLTLQHMKMGAILGPDHSPQSYGNTTSEYWTVKKSAGIVDLSHLGRLTVTGKDSVSFLNGLLTNDLALLKTDAGIRAALLTAKARVLADLHIYKKEDSLLIDSGESSGARVKSILDQFIITEDVQVKDSTSEILQFSVQGPMATKVVEQILGVDVKNMPELSHKSLGPSLIISQDRTGLGGYDMILSRDEAEAVWHAFLLKGGDLGIAPVGLEALNILRLEKGVPKYGVDVDDSVIVLEAGFKDAISFNKGCYMGQEVVARATHIGHVNKLLVQLEIAARTAPSARTSLLRNGNEAGFLTSAAFSPGREKVVGLGYVQRDLATKGTELVLDSEGTRLSAVVVGAI